MFDKKKMRVETIFLFCYRCIRLSYLHNRLSDYILEPYSLPFQRHLTLNVLWKIRLHSLCRWKGNENSFLKKNSRAFQSVLWAAVVETVTKMVKKSFLHYDLAVISSFTHNKLQILCIFKSRSIIYDVISHLYLSSVHTNRAFLYSWKSMNWVRSFVD